MHGPVNPGIGNPGLPLLQLFPEIDHIDMRNTKHYYVGNLRNDAINGENKGWVVGVYLKDIQRQTAQIEVKYWEYTKRQDVEHGIKLSDTIEWTYIISGKTRVLVDGQEVIMATGDYVLIHPGTPNNVVAEILEDTQGITIKSPSDPSAKKIGRFSHGKAM